MSPQETIAHYRVTSKLGEGGMGEVWRATDAKLGREVAIKLLPDAFAADPDRMARFQREAQVLASLNHPNIAAIYGVEERALVMELADGPTLAERIAQGPIPMDEACPIARQIAEALEYAHERGIVHRDLKPANIKIGSEGRVKVLDFGLAKAMSNESAAADPASSPTVTMGVTMAGFIIGTAAYMSPEQAKGKPADRRADIWAFGVVLMEMLTGRALYTGETVSEILASVIKDTPNLAALPEATPPAIRHLLRRCLEKNPRRRLQAIGEARFTLEEPEEPAPAPISVPAGHTRPLQILAGVLAIGLAVAGAGWWRATRPVDAPMLRFRAELEPRAIPGNQITAEISPDGRRIVYPVRTAGSWQLATQLLDRGQSIVLSGTDDAEYPFFSPDGQWVGFFAGGKIEKVSVHGGAPVTLAELAAGGPRGGWWSQDGNIIATLDYRHLFRVSAAGGKAEQLAASPEAYGQTSFRWPQILPGGDTVLVSSGSVAGAWDDADIGVVSLKTGKLKIVQHGGYYPRYLPTGHLIYVHQGSLYAVRFDAGKLETQGAPAPFLEDVAGNTTTGAGQFAFSRTGTLVYLSGKAGGESRTILWMDAAGRQVPLVNTAGAIATPRLSPDGTRLALAMNGDISVFDIARSAMTRITFTHAPNAFPVWAPDGKHLVYTSTTDGIWWTRADGSAQPERLLETRQNVVPGSFSPDGKRLAFSRTGEIWILPLDISDLDHPKPGSAEVVVRTPAQNSEPRFSPDGRWLAYTSIDSGSQQIYVRPDPKRAAGGGKWQVSNASAHFPMWSRDSRELFYLTTRGRIAVVDYTDNGDSFNPGTPRPWSDIEFQQTGVLQPLDLAPDGKRFVVLPVAERPADTNAPLHVTFLLNFFDELKRRLP